MLRKKNDIAKILQVTTFNGQGMYFQTVFKGNKTFTSSSVYGNSIENSVIRVCSRLHSLSLVSMRNMENLIKSLSSIVLSFMAYKNILTSRNRFVNVTTNHIFNINYFR